jgi:hypothetical protein
MKLKKYEFKKIKNKKHANPSESPESGLISHTHNM